MGERGGSEDAGMDGFSEEEVLGRGAFLKG